ncbi:MAG: 16S rRNA processing protein RimM [Lachnospiraceae bacterium]|jgi:16S rRNA processing protein RimM|nr:16S rRNA processing protein RimM [Lachnospiraceae bacterium]
MVSEFRVGVISSTHGIRGEVKVFPTTDDSTRFLDLKQVTLAAKRERRILEIEKVRFFKQFVIVKFKGIDNINDIEQYKGAELWIDREQAVPLEEGEYFIADLIGLAVMTDEGERLGTLREVLQTGANDVYEVQMENGKTVLLPVTRECVLDVDLEKGEVLVHVLDGLLDL